jgi:hypothetical protein
MNPRQRLDNRPTNEPTFVSTARAGRRISIRRGNVCITLVRVKSTTFAVRIEPELLDVVDQAAATRGVSRSDLVLGALTGVGDLIALDDARMKHIGRVLLERLERDQAAVQRAVLSSRWRGSTAITRGWTSFKLQTQDTQSGCSNWTGHFAMVRINGVWLIDTAALQQQRCG